MRRTSKKTPRFINLQKGQMLGGQAHWVQTDENGIVTSCHSWMPRDLVGKTMEDAEAWYKKQLEDWDAGIRD